MSTRSTALITGASSGIGAEFARQLADGGHDLFLVARREERLQVVAEEARQRGAEAEVWVADLATEGGVRDVVSLVQSRPPLDLLVNNAGFGVPGSFADLPAGRHAEMLTVHLDAAVALCRAALPGMVARGSGAIVNVASVAGLVSAGSSVMYASTKTFLVKFSEMLADEVGPLGVRVQALCPGLTRTDFHSTPDYEGHDLTAFPSWLWLDVRKVVRDSLAALGSRRVICIPGWQYRLLVPIARAWPFSVLGKKALAERRSRRCPPKPQAR